MVEGEDRDAEAQADRTQDEEYGHQLSHECRHTPDEACRRGAPDDQEQYDRQDQESCRAHNDAAVRLCAPKVRGRAVSLVDLRKNVVDGKRKRPRVRASTRGGAAMRLNERHPCKRKGSAKVHTGAC